MFSLIQIILLILDVLWIIALVHIVMSWLINFDVLNIRQPLVGQIWRGLNQLLEPIYSRIRRFMPDLGSIDLSPLVLLLAITALRIVIVNNAAYLI